ncbi:carboxylesterase/lipase family protein [Neptunicella sp. SCSIO 80796]|uniref:carboxylesterase/lipase family protein n=1 Tax=Neptunicella plasticusilytica TaxID=3117012 RepID=UPI003A4DE4BD
MVSFSTSAAQSALQVQTTKGQIEGIYAQESDVYEFKGVPYAKPPVGDLRWKAPQPMESWQGVKQAKSFASRPMQLPIFGDMNFRSPKISEDSLYLNIWSNDLTPQNKQPVLVYFHGGGFIAGDGSEPRYDGTSMAQNGIVTVTVNYRLGIFGFLAHPELSAETDYAGSGNYAFLDQVAALHWVKDNIAAFGGDPQRITIAGESAGSMSVSALMISPLSKDLIAGVIGESGSVVGSNLSTNSLHTAEQNGIEIVNKLAAKSIAELRKLDAQQLLDKTAQQQLIWFRPNIDNHFFPEDPLQMLQKGQYAKVPLLAGVNSQEGSFNQVLGERPPTVENYQTAVKQLYPEHYQQFVELYPATDSGSVMDAAQELASDRFLSYSTWIWAELVNRGSEHDVFYYLYAHPRPQLAPEYDDMEPALAGGLVKKAKDKPAQPSSRGAVHSAEIEYAMGNLASNKVFDWNDDDYAISANMQQYFINFIKTGNPNGSELPEWPEFADNQRIVIDKQITTQDMSLLRKRYELMSAINGFDLKSGK